MTKVSNEEQSNNANVLLARVKITAIEKKAIIRLQKAIDKMPKTLWLYNTGEMNVMKYKDGKAVETKSGGFDQEYCIASIKGIYSEGGSW